VRTLLGSHFRSAFGLSDLFLTNWPMPTTRTIIFSVFLQKLRYGADSISCKLFKASSVNNRDIIKSLMANTESVVCFKDLQGRFVMVNQKWLSLFQMDLSEIIGKQHLGGYSEELAIYHRQHDEQVIGSGEAARFEERVVVGGKEYFHLTNRFPIYDRDGMMNGTGAIFTDITNQKKLEHELKRVQEALQDVAARDHLTGAWNRKALYEMANYELLQHRRYHHPLSILMLDLDHFKRVNDLYGHAVGDQVLQHTVEIVTDLLRETDSLYRMGGEEFVVLAPETEFSGAAELGERIRKLIYHADFSPVEIMTVSVGVTAVVTGDDLDQVLRRVDEALYRAKSEGRNRVVASEV